MTSFLQEAMFYFKGLGQLLVTDCMICGLALSRILFKTFVLIFSELSINSPEGIVAGPVSEENFFEWEALIL